MGGMISFTNNTLPVSVCSYIRSWVHR